MPYISQWVLSLITFESISILNNPLIQKGLYLLKYCKNSGPSLHVYVGLFIITVFHHFGTFATPANDQVLIYIS